MKKVVEKKREGWLDLLRVAAACAVVLMHTLTGAVDILSVRQAKVLLLMDLVTWCVPVFLMISGYLFLNPERELSFEKMLKRYWLRLAVALFVFGVPFAWIELVLTERTFRPGMLLEGVRMISMMRSWSHLWYLYLILVLYLLTPVIKRCLKRVPWQAVAVICALITLGSSWFPFLNKLDGIMRLPMLPEELLYVCYYLGGYFLHIEKDRESRNADAPAAARTDASGTVYRELHKREEKAGRKATPLGWIAAVLLAVVLNVYYRLVLQGDVQMAYNYPPTVILSFGLIYLGKNIGEGSSVGSSRWIRRLSAASFGIYLIHPVFLNIAYKAVGVTPFAYPLWLSLPVFWLVTMAGSCVLVWLLRKLPLYRSVL